ncbi:MAG TPA: hypothetical protein VNL37_01885 [Candidatus Polarisedimenticolia bacterium]|nr:hypothetical protein [Candidatus Polarisedimenticolia bacterium]
MRYVSAVILLLGLSGVLAAAEEPPAAGATVYIAASLKGIEHSKTVSGARMTYDMPACKKLVVKKANPRKSVWVIEDPLGNEEHLEGAWLPWMFTTEEECNSFVSSQGEASVMKSGKTFKVAGKSAKAEK